MIYDNNILKRNALYCVVQLIVRFNVCQIFPVHRHTVGVPDFVININLWYIILIYALKFTYVDRILIYIYEQYIFILICTINSISDLLKVI